MEIPKRFGGIVWTRDGWDVYQFSFKGPAMGRIVTFTVSLAVKQEQARLHLGDSMGLDWQAPLMTAEEFQIRWAQIETRFGNG